MAAIDRVRGRHLNGNPYYDIARKYTASDINNMTNDEYYFNYLNPDVHIVRRKASRCLINDLPRHSQEIFKAWYYNDLCEEAIANKYHMDIGEVKKIINECKNELDRKLPGYIEWEL